MEVSRAWAMPNKHTFDIKPIGGLIQKYLPSKSLSSVDPFANKNRIADICNDIDPQYQCENQMDALEFLKGLKSSHTDFLLFDPPYSPRQVSEVYKSLDMTVNMQTTQSSFWGNLKKEISRVVIKGGTVMSFGWNSGGIGKSNGFEIVEVLLVAHGGWHNDTIVTVEKKVS
tara:strand:+ start:8127 stop:8639 length:513 start_codon:yes stop_codon:yes gene_type:complete